LALAGLILGACSQTGMYETADLMNEQAEASKKGGFNLSPFGVSGENAQVVLEPFVSCSDYCISENGPFYFVLTAADYQNGDKVEVRTYNTLTQVVYQFTSTTTISSIASSGITTVNPGSTTATVSFPLTGPWKACDLRSRSFTVTRQSSGQGGGQGVSVTLNTSYNLVGVCTTTSIEATPAGDVCAGDSYTITASVASSGNFTGGTLTIKDGNGNTVNSEPVTADDKTVSVTVPNATIGSYSYTAEYNGAGTNGYNNSASTPVTVNVKNCDNCDEETFSYKATKAGTDKVNIVFTYNSDEPLKDAEVKFTFPQIANVSVNGKYTAPDGKEYSTNNDGNNTVFTWKGDISCKSSEAKTFEFEVTAVCNASGKAQVWTSASVNGIGVKNENTPNIKFNCTSQTIEETNDED